MFSSLVFLALSSLAVCEQTPLGQRPSIPENVPVHIRPESSAPPEKGFIGFEDKTKDDEDLTRNATIKLYPASAYATRPNFDFGCRENEVNEITLAPDVCLSGDYYLNKNFKVTEDPICPDGEIPTMLFYHQRGCEGEYKYPFSTGESEKIPHSCLWTHSEKYWSVIFRCGIWPTTMQGADLHQVAVPPQGREPITYKGQKTEEGPKPAILEPHLFPGCNGQRVGGHKSKEVPVDKCAKIPPNAIKIKQAAVCANGTRAQLARFEDEHCGYGVVSEKYGLIDVHDKDIGECTTTRGAEDNILSLVFWCDGLGDVERPDPNTPEEDKPDKDAKPKAAKGSVSESACMVGKAPGFNHPKTDTCVNMKTDKIKIYSTGVCKNGTQALMATWEKKDCSGKPDVIREMEDKEFKTCLDFSEVDSFAFWCEGKGIKSAPSDTLPRKSGKSKARTFVVVMLFLFGMAGFVALAYWVLFNTAVVDKIKDIYHNRPGAIAL